MSPSHPIADAAPLDPRWIPLIDRVARTVLGRDDRTGDPLAAEVARLSELYTRGRHALPEASAALAARLRFFLPRDLPKIQGPLAELAWAGALPEGPTWRVLDLGAGLGTTTLGVAELARRAGVERLEVTALERDAASLDVFGALAREATAAGLTPPIELTARAVDLEQPGPLPEADLVVVGLALNELYAGLDDEARLEARTRFLVGLLSSVAPGGSLVVLEPASRTQARELQQLRDRLKESVFAPCLHNEPCPLLRRHRDWCHDQLPFELPDALVSIAKGAGLRSERLTYAYLTLRQDGRKLASGASALRVVGGPVDTKGKTEWDGCGEAGLVRLRLIDRERGQDNVAIEGSGRGAVMVVHAPLRDGVPLRLRPGVRVERVRGRDR